MSLGTCEERVDGSLGKCLPRMREDQSLGPWNPQDSSAVWLLSCNPRTWEASWPESVSSGFKELKIPVFVVMLVFNVDETT